MSAPVGESRRASLASAKPSFRRDIEGLRAVTALLVASFHIWADKVSGGVDVFFVVSGYFITLTLLGQLRRFGRIRPGLYLARLGQRLAPMALLVLAATIAGTWAFLTPSVRAEAFTQSIAALFSAENLYLAFQSVDYLAQDVPRSPVQQFWAMSVQGQFYIFWLGIALLAVFLGRRAERSSRRWFAGILTLAALASFVWSIVQTNDDQAFAYFSPATRVWEFAIGGAVALTLSRISLPQWLRVAMVWTGIVGIVTCAAFMPVASAFPGYAALWPTLSAALILISGSKGDGLGANAFLNARPLVWMGGFAFAIYLWHWPLLIIARSLLGHESLGLRSGLLVIAVAVVLAWLSSSLIERPVTAAARSSDRPRSRRANAGLIAAWVLVLAMAATSLVAVRQMNVAEGAELVQIANADGTCVGAQAVLQGDPGCGSSELGERVVPVGAVKEDLPTPELECAIKKWHADAKMCSYGAIGSDRRIGLVGNSHAIAWFPALEKIAVQEGWELRVWYKRGCQVSTPQRFNTAERLATECDEWVSNVQADMAAGPSLALIFTSAHGGSTWGGSGEDGTADAARDALLAAWGPMMDQGAEIVAIRDYPKSSPSNLACVDREGVDATTSCARSRADVLSESDAVFTTAQNMPGGHGIDLTDAFCDSVTCWSVAGHVKVYRDPSHITNTYAATTSGFMRERLAEQGLVDLVNRAG
ncbi:MAG: acyltransferase family protein [Microbacterium sp.]